MGGFNAGGSFAVTHGSCRRVSGRVRGGPAESRRIHAGTGFVFLQLLDLWRALRGSSAQGCGETSREKRQHSRREHGWSADH